MTIHLSNYCPDKIMLQKSWRKDAVPWYSSEKDIRKVNFVLCNGVEIFNILLLLMKLQLLDFLCACFWIKCLGYHACLRACRDNTHCCSPNYGFAVTGGGGWRDRFKRFVRVFVWFYLVMINLYYAENASFFSVKYLIMCMIKSRTLVPTTAHYYWYKARNF